MGRVKLGKGRVCTLAYADDIVLLAEEEDEMRSMMGRLEDKDNEIQEGRWKNGEMKMAVEGKRGGRG